MRTVGCAPRTLNEAKHVRDAHPTRVAGLTIDASLSRDGPSPQPSPRHAGRGSDSSRRRFILGSASILLLHVRTAHATPESLAAALKETFGERKIQPGRVKLDIPQLVENGNVVPVTIDVQSPMTAADHVYRIYLFAEKNPLPRMVEFQLGPHNGRARVATRVRVATPQFLLAVAQMSDASLWSAMAQIDVTAAACGD
jgi:sulfur-oxidizing protein SoxY